MLFEEPDVLMLYTLLAFETLGDLKNTLREIAITRLVADSALVGVNPAIQELLFRGDKFCP